MDVSESDKGLLGKTMIFLTDVRLISSLIGTIASVKSIQPDVECADTIDIDPISDLVKANFLRIDNGVDRLEVQGRLDSGPLSDGGEIGSESTIDRNELGYSVGGDLRRGEILVEDR